jgi:hypothetical protein
MTRDAYTQAITDLLHKCSDPDLLDLIYKLLLAECGQ